MVTATIDNKVKQVVSNIRNLPTPPIVFHQIQKVINDPKVSAGQIAKILSEDPAMSVKVLKLTNSAFYPSTRLEPTFCSRSSVCVMNKGQW